MQVTTGQKNGWSTPMTWASGLWFVLKINILGSFGNCLSTNLQDSLEGDIVSICDRASRGYKAFPIPGAPSVTWTVVQVPGCTTHSPQ